MNENTGEHNIQGVSRRDLLKFAGGLIATLAIPGLAKADELKQTAKIIEGDIPNTERIIFKNTLDNKEVEYFVKYLPSECAEYDGKLFQARPQTIWWHWDGGETPNTENHDRVLTTWRALVSRTRNNDPVATHFSVGPNTVLQMLPMSEDMIVQGRLTNDRGINDIGKSKSLGGIQIETTGRWYDSKPPLESQTATLIDLTIAVMKQYHVTFSNIYGHLERAAGIGKPDPGLNYLRETRIRLLKTLISANQWSLIGHPNTWDFYKEVLKNNKVIRVTTQTSKDILLRLTEKERDLVQTNIINPPKLEFGEI